MEGSQKKPSTASLFVSRFDDFFEQGIWFSIATGLMLTFVWMGLTEGYPIFMDGRVDLVSVVIMLASFSGFTFLFGFVKPIGILLERPPLWIASALCASAVCFALLVLFFEPEMLRGDTRIGLIRGSMVIIGFASSVLIMCCATGFACLRPASAGVGFSFSMAVLFVVFFCLHVCVELFEGVLFCLIPIAAAAALYMQRDAVANRLALPPEQELTFAKGFRSMCISFCVFFFAIGAKCALEPVSEFAMASDTSVIGILAVSLVFLYLIGIRQNPVGVFSALKRFYSFSVLILTVCIAIAPLSIEPYAGIIYNGDVMVIILVLWLLTAFVAHSNESRVSKVIALALGLAALGMGVGWVTGTTIYQIFGHDRSYPTIAIACAVAVFSTIGFSSKSFPYLTKTGEGARKMKKQVTPYEPKDFCTEMSEVYHLSEREGEVLFMLLSKYGAEAISDKLVISYHTARTHIRNIYKKMDIHSQRELIDRFEEAKADHESREADKIGATLPRIERM